jgi:hypothetical protein
MSVSAAPGVSVVTALQVAYPLPKIDLVAIPNFAAGAMENWGLLTYRETALLASDTAPDMKAQYDIATTVAHETVSMCTQASTVMWFLLSVSCCSLRSCGTAVQQCHTDAALLASKATPGGIATAMT